MSVDPKSPRGDIFQLISMSVDPKNHYEDKWVNSYRNKCILKNYYYLEERFLTNLYKGNCPQKDLLSIRSQIQQINHQKTTGRVSSPNYVKVVSRSGQHQQIGVIGSNTI